MTYKECIDFLLYNGYLDLVKNKPQLTSKFQSEFKDYLKKPPAKSQELIVHQSSDWKSKYIDFITQAKVPKYIVNNRGDHYETNKFSEEGLKAFKTILEEGIDYDTLVKSTMLYYASSVKLKKSIGNYIARGDWRTDYLSLVDAAQQGKLKEHIKENLDNGSTERYSWG